MKISDYAIKHPAVITILLIALFVFGILSALNLNKDMIADINIPTVVVVTGYPGVGPEDIERDVTDPLEEELGTLEGLRQMKSSSKNSLSTITLELNFGESAEEKIPEIREKINNVAGDLPEGISGPPRLIKLSSSALPVMTILASSEEDGAALSLFCKDEVVPALSRIEDVSFVSLLGEVGETLEIRVDLEKLNALNLSLVAVYQIIVGSNISLPGGDIVFQGATLNIRTEGRYSSLQEVEAQVIGYRGEYPVHLREIAEIGIVREKPDNYVISDGRDVLSINLDKKKGGDTISISNDVKRILAEIEEENSGRISFSILIDDSTKIDSAIGSVTNSALLGALLAVLILFIFLHNPRTTIIVGVSIPLSILFTFIGLRLKGLTINMITLGGMTTAIGMIVDSSIVILENIYRHFNEGMSGKEAASLGAEEVGGAVIASTATSLAVFVPILFLSGLTGLILKDVAWTILFSLLSSMIVAVIVVPFLSSLLLRRDEAGKGKPGMFQRVGAWIESVLTALSGIYRKLLLRVLNDKPFFLIISFLLLIISIFSFRLLGFEFLEQTDMAEAQIYIETPGGYTLDMTRNRVMEVEKEIRRLVPELESSLFYIGRSGAFFSGEEKNRAFGRFTLTRVRERNRHVMEIVALLQRELPLRIPDIDIQVKNGGVSALLSMATGGDGFNIEVYGSSMDDVIEGAEIARGYIEHDPNVALTDLSVRFDNREMVSDLLLESMGELGISPYEAAVSTRIIFNGIEAGKYCNGDVDIPITLNTGLTGAVLSSDILYSLTLQSIGGTAVSFANITELDAKEVLSEIRHRDKSRSVMITSILHDQNLRETSARVIDRLNNHPLPPGVKWRVSGSSAEIRKSFRSLVIVMFIAVFLVYAVMVIQFERFSQPLIVMSSIPFTMTGIVGGLLLFKTSLSLVSFMGIIALSGIVVNNAIVLIDYINLLRDRDGLSLEEAVLSGAESRLKPILMTTLTTMLGIIPLAIGMGEGSEIYSPLGQSIAGGLVTSTFITLLMVPVLYQLLEGRKQKKEEPN